jgi:hypothetical protein
MSECELLEKCPFFNDKMAKMPFAANSLKQIYCKSNYSICARYMIAKSYGREYVPIDLFPNHERRAEEIIAGITAAN